MNWQIRTASVKQEQTDMKERQSSFINKRPQDACKNVVIWTSVSFLRQPKDMTHIVSFTPISEHFHLAFYEWGVFFIRLGPV